MLEKALRRVSKKEGKRYMEAFQAARRGGPAALWAGGQQVVRGSQ